MKEINSVIKSKGYGIECTSWENDVHHYQTKSAFFETKEAAEFVMAFLERCSKSYHEEEGYFGNSALTEPDTKRWRSGDVHVDSVFQFIQDEYDEYLNNAKESELYEIMESISPILELDLEEGYSTEEYARAHDSFFCGSPFIDILGNVVEYDSPFIRVVSKATLKYRTNDTIDTYSELQTIHR